MYKIDKKLYLFGFSRWKHTFVKVFLKEYDKKNIFFINPLFLSHLDLAKKRGLCSGCDIFIWGKKEFGKVEAFGKKKGIKITRVEDGFIRSVGLGSDLTQPYSLVIDKEGIYFDPTTPSDLENILNFYDFKNDPQLLARAVSLIEKIKETKISKYNADANTVLSFPKDRRVLLVSGQVEDDASIRFGADGMTNLELLKQVRALHVSEYIVFKPHPDVLSGNRVGHVESDIALQYCDEVITDVGMASVLEAVDEVHTMTSLTGFEGLLYGKKVFTYGLPFYAGWGLTTDMLTCKRRKATLSLVELVAGVLLLYPRYIHPHTLEFCDAEVLILELQKEKQKLNNSIFYRIQFKIYSTSSRIIQKIFSLVV